MTKFRVIIQPSASAEMEEAFIWITQPHPDAAVKWFNGLQAAVHGLEK